MKIRTKMVYLSLFPLFFTAILICITSAISFGDSMRSLIRADLQAMAISEKASIMLSQGDYYSVNEDGIMWNRAAINITETVENVDKILEASDIHNSVYYGDTCYMTTMKDADGNRLLKEQMDAAIAETVLAGEEYFSESVVINDVEYFAYFVPIYNMGVQEPVGMVCSAMEREDVDSTVTSIVSGMIIIAIICCFAAFGIILFVASKMTKRIKYAVNTLGSVADGDLTVQIDEKVSKSKDETGDIIRAIINLKDKLTTVVGNIFEKSSEVNECSNMLGDATAETTIAVEQVERAVNEMADGAGAQANDTQKATENVLMMGDLIEETTDNVARLNDNADSMEAQGGVATEILNELQNVNDKCKESIEVIYNQTNITNESVKQISEAVNIISSIAEETNLLSLNASIEAARAGEQGRGFAVVADQIQKLAEQSNNSARQIEAIVTALINDSQKEVEIMEEVKEIMGQQSDMVGKTGQAVKDVIHGISVSRDEIKTIAEIAQKLDESRAVVIDLVQNLSAIAEENAASTEQTSASATEVNATIQEMGENAAHLRTIADNLEESIKVFKIN